jgi:hypothetical protein
LGLGFAASSGVIAGVTAGPEPLLGLGVVAGFGFATGSDRGGAGRTRPVGAVELAVLDALAAGAAAGGAVAVDGGGEATRGPEDEVRG